MEYTLERTEEFLSWLKALRDVRGKVSIARRLNRVCHGNFGDHHAIRETVSELRFREGYRIYYTIRGRVVVFLLCGGNKSSQDADIERAIRLAKEI